MVYVLYHRVGQVTMFSSSYRDALSWVNDLNAEFIHRMGDEYIFVLPGFWG